MAMMPVDSLEEGMVLAADVLDRNGRMLLGAGAELTRKHLMTFKTWGVDRVVVVGGEETVEQGAALPADIDPEALEAAREKLLPLFVVAGTDHPVMQELLQLAAVRKVLHGLC